jgi:NAD(P)-dependent dehydrogenase (short-subunit alcohol dehydrogenase family)
VGRGVALGLARAGARVYGTGRSIADTQFDADVVPVACDHTDDTAVEQVFERIDKEAGALDILVNSAWGGYESMVEDGRFTWVDPFWLQRRWRWDAMMGAGVRAALVASQLAAERMVSRGRGLIVHISSWAAQKSVGNVVCGVAKAATDKMAADMAHELKPHGVTVVSLYPGLVRTEAVLAAGIFDLSNSESPEFIGRVVTALANDPDSLRWSGQVVVAAALALECGISDIDGKQPRPLTLADM